MEDLRESKHGCFQVGAGIVFMSLAPVLFVYMGFTESELEFATGCLVPMGVLIIGALAIAHSYVEFRESGEE